MTAGLLGRLLREVGRVAEENRVRAEAEAGGYR